MLQALPPGWHRASDLTDNSSALFALDNPDIRPVVGTQFDALRRRGVTGALNLFGKNGAHLIQPSPIAERTRTSMLSRPRSMRVQRFRAGKTGRWRKASRATRPESSSQASADSTGSQQTTFTR